MNQASCPVLSVGPSADRTRIQKFGPKNILLASEAASHSQLAESYAFSLARKYGSRLTVVDVLGKQSGRVLAEVSSNGTSLGLRTLFSASHRCNCQPRSERKATSFLRVADQTTADLIVIAVPANHRFTGRFLSTNSYRVVSGARCPVLTMYARPE